MCWRVDDTRIFGDELMDILFRVKTNGAAVAAVPVGRDCATLLCSWLAMQELMKQLGDIGAVCTRCGIVLRSHEMEGSECGVGVGCRGDGDMEMILDLPPNLRINALTKVIVECEENFKRRGGSGLEEE
jgi:hypothetical protein